jgi:hypothetical protein
MALSRLYENELVTNTDFAGLSDFQDFPDSSRLVRFAFRSYACRLNLIAGALMRFVIRGYEYNVVCAIRRVLAARQWCMRQA